jgi:uncharacterized protein YjcR
MATNYKLGRTLWGDGMRADLIAQEIGVSRQALFAYAKRHGWPRRKRWMKLDIPSEARKLARQIREQG